MALSVDGGLREHRLGLGRVVAPPTVVIVQPTTSGEMWPPVPIGVAVLLPRGVMVVMKGVCPVVVMLRAPIDGAHSDPALARRVRHRTHVFPVHRRGRRGTRVALAHHHTGHLLLEHLRVPSSDEGRRRVAELAARLGVETEGLAERVSMGATAVAKISRLRSK